MTVSTQIKRLSKDTLYYGLGNAFQGFIGFLLFPIYTRILTREDYGVQDLVLTAVTITTYFLVLGLDSGTARNYYDASTPAEKGKILSTWLTFEMIVSIPVCVLLILFAAPICQILFDTSAIAGVFRLAILTIPTALIARIMLLALRLTFQPKLFGVTAVLGVVGQALTAILLVVIFKVGIAGVFWAMLVSSLVQSIAGFGFTRGHFTFTLSIPRLRSMLAFGLPLVPASLSIWVLSSSNRYFLTRLSTLEEIGILSVGTRIVAILAFLLTAFQTAWPPFAYSIINDEALAKSTFQKVLNYFFTGSIFIAVGLSVLGKELIKVLATDAYLSASSVVPWLAFSTLFWAAAGIVAIGFEIKMKSYHVTIATVLGAVVTTILNILLIPKMGITGAAMATLAGNILALIYTFAAAQKNFPIDYQLAYLPKLILLGSAVIFFAFKLDQSIPFPNGYSILMKLALMALFVLGLFGMKILKRSDVVSLIALMKSQAAGVVSRLPL